MVTEGQNTTLRCSATGHPLPVITWRREDGRPIQNHGIFFPPSIITNPGGVMYKIALRENLISRDSGRIGAAFNPNTPAEHRSLPVHR
jgi:Immunoglobulin domain